MDTALLAASLGFFISLTFYVDALTEDFETILNEYNDELIFETKNHSKARTHRKTSTINLSDAIFLHNELLEYLSISFFVEFQLITAKFFIYSVMENIRDLMSGILFIVLLSCVSYLTFIFFAVDQSNINFDLFVNLSALATVLSISYIYCHFSENMTTNSIKVGEKAYNLLWYKMTMKQQMAVMLIIGRSQREFRLDGLGFIDCSLATFLAVTIIFLFFFYLNG